MPRPAQSNPPEAQLDVIQDRSQKLFAATLTILGLLFGGGLLGIIANPTVDTRIIILYMVSVLMGVVAAVAGLAAVNWGSLATRMQTLYRIQIVALVALFLCLLGVAGTLAYTSLTQPNEGSGKKQPVRDVINPSPKVEPASKNEPTDATASGQAPPHQDEQGNYFTYEPEKAIDGDTSTPWRVSGNGKGEWIQVNFAQKVEVRGVGIIPGHNKIDPANGTDRFYQLYVVRRALIKFPNGTTREAEFDRDRSMQVIYLKSPIVAKWVRIEIQDTYPPGDNPNGQTYPYLVRETAISEIKIT